MSVLNGAGFERRGSAGVQHLTAVLPYVPGGLLATPMGVGQLKALQSGARVSVATFEGAGLLLDIAGFSALARDLTNSNDLTACEKLTETLNAFFLELMKRLHSRSVEILLFAGDAVLAFVECNERRSMAEALRLASEAALSVQAMSFRRNKHRLMAHTGMGAGFLQQNLIVGGERAAQAIYTGDLVRQVCEAQRASKDTDIVVSPEALAMLQPLGGFNFEPIKAGASLQKLVLPPTLSPAGSRHALGHGSQPSSRRPSTHMGYGYAPATSRPSPPPSFRNLASSPALDGPAGTAPSKGPSSPEHPPTPPPAEALSPTGLHSSLREFSLDGFGTASNSPRAGAHPRDPRASVASVASLRSGLFNTLGPGPGHAGGDPSREPRCACDAILPPGTVAPALALEPFEDQVVSLAPAAVAGNEQQAFWASDIRTVFVVFASFPELDIDEGSGGQGLGRVGSLAVAHAHSRRASMMPLSPTVSSPTASPPPPEGKAGPEIPHLRLSVGPEEAADTAYIDAHAARFGKVVRAVHRVAEVYGGAVNKVFLDDKGASALLGFGLPGFVHEDDAERAVHAALDLACWFEEVDAPFACGIAAGRTFVGTLGAPCRKEYALIGDSVILAARMMSQARAVIARNVGATRTQEVYCDASVFDAATANDKQPPFAFDELEPFKAKGFAEPVRIYRPRDFRAGEAAEAAQLSKGGQRRLTSPRASMRRSAAQAPIAIFGREEELERIGVLLDAHALEGRGATLLLEGKAGMGKSHMRRELQRVVARRGTPVLAAAGNAVEASAPLSCVRAMVTSLVPDTRTEERFRSGLAISPDDAKTLWQTLFAPDDEDEGEDDGHSSQRSIGARTMGGRTTRRFKIGSHGSLAGGPALSAAPHSISMSRGVLARLAGAVMRLVRAFIASRGDSARGLGVDANAILPINAVPRAGEGAPAPAKVDGDSDPPFALFVEDAHFVDSASWSTIRTIREMSRHMLLVLVSRPMDDPPLDFLALVDESPSVAMSPPPEVDYGDGPVPVHVLGRPASSASLPAAGLGSLAVTGLAEPLPPNAVPGPFEPPAPATERTSASRRGVPSSPSLRGLPSSRPQSATNGPSTGRQVTVAPGRPSVLRVRLSPLSHESSQALLSRMLDGNNIPARELEYLRKDLLAKAAGVPLYIVEMARHVLRARLAAQARGMAQVDLTDEIPSSIQKVVLSQVDTLPSHVQAVLKLCAVIGSGFTVQVLNAIDISGMGSADLRSALAALRRAGLIRRDGSAEEADDGLDSGPPPPPPEETAPGLGAPGDELPYSFTHGLIKDAVYQSMTQAVKRDVHCNYAAHVESSGQGRDPAVLALHWRLGEQYDRSLQFLERAAHRAVATGAVVEARRLLAEILETIDAFSLAGKGLERLPPRFLPQGLVIRDAANTRAGFFPFADTRPERERWRRVRWAALRAWAHLETMLGRAEDVEVLATACLETLGEPRPKFRASLLGTLGIYARVARLVLREPKATRPAVRLGEMAAAEPDDGFGSGGEGAVGALDRRTEAEIAIVDCLVLIGRSIVRAGRNEQRGLPERAVFHAWAASLVRAVELAYSCKVEAEPHARAAATGASLLLGLGHPKLARKMVARAEAIAERLDDNSARAAVWGARGELECAAGRFSEGHALLERTVLQVGLESVHGVEPATLSLVTLFLLGRLEEAERRAGALAGFLSRVARDAFALDVASAVAGFVAVAAGRDDDAAAQLDHLPPRATGASASWAQHLSAVLVGLFIWRTHGDSSKMLEASRELLQHWRENEKGLAWPFVLAVFCVLDFLHFRASDAHHHLQATARARKASVMAEKASQRLRRKPSKDGPGSSKGSPAGSGGSPSLRAAPSPLLVSINGGPASRPRAADPWAVVAAGPGPSGDDFGGERMRSRSEPAAAMGGDSPVAAPRRSERPVSLLIGAADLRRHATRGALQAAAQAAEEARAALALVEAQAAKRLPALRPIHALFAAERPGLSPRQRLAALRQAQVALRESGLRLFEAAALVRVALAEVDPAAAAEASAAAAAICEASGFELRALVRIQSGDASPRDAASRGAYVPMWV